MITVYASIEESGPHDQKKQTNKQTNKQTYNSNVARYSCFDLTEQN
jgi:hypothetical protein